uniref:Uncharacterized protein n=1 Tax=Steinernema glaseri TaxID=37863 RepID=A0A1I7ZY23_9BILA
MRYVNGRGIHWEQLDQVGIAGSRPGRGSEGLWRFVTRAKNYLGRKVAPEVYRPSFSTLIESRMGLPVKLLFLCLGLYFAGSFQQAYLLSILNQPYLEVQQVSIYGLPLVLRVTCTPMISSEGDGADVILDYDFAKNLFSLSPWCTPE